MTPSWWEWMDIFICNVKYSEILAEDHFIMVMIEDGFC